MTLYSKDVAQHAGSRWNLGHFHALGVGLPNMAGEYAEYVRRQVPCLDREEGGCKVRRAGDHLRLGRACRLCLASSSRSSSNLHVAAMQIPESSSAGYYKGQDAWGGNWQTTNGPSSSPASVQILGRGGKEVWTRSLVLSRQDRSRGVFYRYASPIIIRPGRIDEVQLQFCCLKGVIAECLDMLS